jgi:hypothetical protein
MAARLSAQAKVEGGAALGDGIGADGLVGVGARIDASRSDGDRIEGSGGLAAIDGTTNN